MNTFDTCRKNLHKRLGIDAQKRREPAAMMAEIRRMIDTLEEMVALAKPRLVMGGIRYGSDVDYDGWVDHIQGKLSQFIATGNSEMLIDIFNDCAIQFANKTHPNFHFEAKDRTE